ncbi:MAG TPA: sulfite exporter TauE/SafE family protein [Methanomassiliicoccales archaeon]|nr:sulfite exporter TauE/SafE family protein [Methanomassiliicoccales archaeon]
MPMHTVTFYFIIAEPTKINSDRCYYERSMDPVLALAIVIVALVAGVIGALFGLGGGIIVIPALTLAMGFSMQEAIGASLIGVIATSTGAAARYVQQGLTNVRLGMLLETATTAGALLGALVAVYLDQSFLALLFACILTYSAFHMVTKKEKVIPPGEIDTEGRLVDLSCTYVDPRTQCEVSYDVRGVRTGLAASFGAGGISGLLGVGGGVIKVPVMNICMCVPMKAATATSNFMIGVTALSGAIVYFRFGLIEPVLAGLVAVGVLFGSMAGTRISVKVDSSSLRVYFGIVIFIVAVLMVLKGLGLLEVL